MTDEPREPERDKTLDEKLTAYLLGEAEVAEAREVREALEADPALRAREEELRRTLDLLRAPEAAPRLDDQRRAALRAAAERTAAPRGRLLSFPAMRAAAALVLIGVVVALARFGWPDGAGVADGTMASGPAPEASADDFGAPAEGGESAYLGYSEAEDSAEAARPQDESTAKGEHSGEERAFARKPPAEERGRPAPNRFAGEARAESERSLTDDQARVLDQLGYGGGGGLRIADERARQGGPFQGPSDTVPPRGGRAGTPGTPALPGAGGDRETLGFVGRLEATPSTPALSEQAPDDLDYAGEARDDASAYAFDLDSEVGARLRLRTDVADPPRVVLLDGYGRRYVDEQVLDHLRPHRGKESPRDMFFRFYGDHPIESTAVDPMSTFAADVDTASYPLARNYLVNGHLPPRAAVRTEEFVNYFDHALEPPAEGDFALHLEAAPTVFADGRHLLRVGIKAREVDRAERKPLNLVFVIDKSGSMAKQKRIELVKDALELLVDQVRDDDTIGIVTFDSDGHEVLQPTRGADRWEIRRAIRGLGTGGSTNAAEGLFLGYAMAERAFREGAINRVVLASDGVANTGETDQQRILEKVRASAEVDVDLTTLGVGMGNHDDVFLEQLADQGDGSCHYVDDFAEARRVLVDGFTGVMQTVARDVKIQVEFDEGAVAEWRQLGYENRSLRHEDFRDDAVDAGEIGAGHEVVGLYELRLADAADADGAADAAPGDALVTVRLRWFPDGASEAVEMERTLQRADLRTRWGLASPHFRLAAVAAQYAEVLRRSVHARGDDYATLRTEASRVAHDLPRQTAVAELRDMIHRTAELARFQPLDDELSLLIEECRRGRLLEARLLEREEDEEIRKLLADVRRQNERLERRLEQMLR